MEIEQNTTNGDESGQNEEKNDAYTGNQREEQNALGFGKPPIEKRFSAEQQPDASQVQKAIATRKKKKEGRERIREMLETIYKLPDDSPIKEELEKIFGRSGAKGTALEIATRRLLVKTIKTNDSRAFNDLVNQAYGPQKQRLEHSGPNGQAIPMEQKITQVIIQNPHLKQPESEKSEG